MHKIGDIVKRLDGDGRPHKIIFIETCHPLNRNEHKFYVYHYEDGGSDIANKTIVCYDSKDQSQKRKLF